MNMLKRSLAMLLVLSMLFSFVPFSVFADEAVETTAATEEVEPLSDGPGESDFGHSRGKGKDKGKDKHEDSQVETEPVETTVPETTVPETTVPETTVPETTVPETTVPETTVPETTVPETTVPETTVPETTVPETTVPETTVPETTVPETTDSTEPTVDPYGIMTLELEDEISIASITGITMGTKPDNGSTTGEPFPKGTGGSNSFRIPALVTLSNGNLVAAADARWNTTYDGGGLDTIVSRSTNSGANWTYTFANYLGDNGNMYNGSGSTAFIDPALAVNGNTVYMLVDLYPYGVALNGTVGAYPSTEVGFTSDGKLRLSADDHSSYSYYLDGKTIYSSDGTAVSGYTVDEYFNITAEDGTTSNLFFSNSPYKVVRTGYLYLTKSTDTGATWSAPTLIPNVKTSSEQVCLVGPGRGLVTSGGKIVFPVYSYNGSESSQKMSFIYSADNGSSWNRSADFTGASWSSESAVVELESGVLRFFYRNGTSKLCYVDYADGAWGSPVTTAVATNSNCQISAITYSKTIDGKQVILVSCPAGPSGGSNMSGASYRLNGKILAFTVEADGTMTKVGEISLTSQHSSTNYFMYSCLTELADNTVAILYEDNENAWGTGDNYYYQMSYAEYDLAEKMGLTFDGDSAGEEDGNVESDVTITEGATMVSATKVENVTALANKTYLAYDITVNEESVESATVVVNLNNTFADDDVLAAYYIDETGAIAETISGDYDTTADTFTFVAKHFSTYAVAPVDDDSVEYTEVNVRLTVGETSQTYTDNTGNYEATATIADSTVATMNADGNETLTSVIGEAVTSITAGKYVIYSYLGSYVTNTPVGNYIALSTTKQTAWNVAVANTNSGTYYITDADGNYLYVNNGTAGVTTTQTAVKLVYGTSSDGPGQSGFFIQDANGSYNLNNSGGTSNAYGKSGANGSWSRWQLKPYTETSTASTQITFTGVAAGTTTAIVGTTRYNITVVAPRNIIVTYQCNGATVSTAHLTVESDAATATLPRIVVGQTGTAYQNDTTTLTLQEDVVSYVVQVTELEALAETVAVGSSKTISQKDLDSLTEGQYVVWTSADTSKVSVAPIYNADGSYTTNATIVGNAVTSTTTDGTTTDTPVLVTGIVYNADGSVAYSTKYAITVTPDTDGDTSQGAGTKKYMYIDIVRIQNTTVYYSINGGELIKITDDMLEGPYTDDNGTYYKLKVPLMDQVYEGGIQISFFADPDEGYALTYMTSTNSYSQYYCLSDGNSDGVGSSAWPFNDAYTAYDSYTAANGYDQTIFKHDGTRYHGVTWGLCEGNFTVAQMKVMYSDAIAKGCDGILVFTKNKTGTTYKAAHDNNCISDLQFVSQKLPEMDKEIATVNDEPYTAGTTLKLTDTIVYNVYVYEPTPIEEYGTIKYSNIEVDDPLTGNNWTYKSSISSTDTYTFTNSATGEELTMSATRYTYQTTPLTLSVSNLLELVDEQGHITNTATLEYDYQSQYSIGSLSASADAVVSAKVEVPEYVIDFGLPVQFNLTNNPLIEGYETITNATAQYGTVTWDGLTVTYTPNKILQGADFIRLTIADNEGSTDNIGYGIRVYPATTVHYEESFITWGSNWTGGNAAITVGPQTTEQLNEEVESAATHDSGKQHNYGYDPVYANKTGASNGTNATTQTIGAKGTFSFTGNGIQVFANCTEGSGYVSVEVKDSSGKTVKLAMVDTVVDPGDTGATSGQTGSLYGLPVVSLVDLQNIPHDTYTVTITKLMDTEPVYIDGFRVFNTMKDSNIFANDLEDQPEFYELRDYVLNAINISDNTSKDYGTLTELATQVYNGISSDTEAPAAVITENNIEGIYGENATAQDLLDNGPKNELYLYGGQTLTFKVKSSRIMQIGLKAPQGETEATITIDGTATTRTVKSSVDMFYDLVKTASESEHEYTISIQNKANAPILSVTLLKVCDDPSFAFSTLNADDIEDVLADVYGLADSNAPAEPSEPDTPSEPAEPEVPTETTEPEEPTETPTEPSKPVEPSEPSKPVVEEKDAKLKITYINLFGKKVGTANLTKTGIANQRCVFSVSEISANAPARRHAVWFLPVVTTYGNNVSIVVPVI